LFKKLSFENYWFESATPSFLIKLIKEKDFDLKRLDGVKVDESAFSSYEIENLKLVPILFQTGYLTITDYDKERMEYTLAYPNFEVKNSMTKYLAETYSFVERELVHGYAWKLIDALRDHDYELFFDTLRIFFANIPYDLHIEREKYYQTVFYLIFSLIGLKVEAEVRTNKGRIDAVIMDKDVHIFEFKFEKDKDKALGQIKEKRYFEKYQSAGKDVYLFGVEFKDRNVGEWVVEKI
jgi:hypothetical protein